MRLREVVYQMNKTPVITRVLSMFVSNWQRMAKPTPSGGGGNRTPLEIVEETALLEIGDAKSGALSSHDPDLNQVIDSWANLASPIRAAIMAMIKASTG
jgi:hypothetical protein